VGDLEGAVDLAMDRLGRRAVIALEAGDAPAAATAVRKALRWIEADWLATPSDLPARVGRSLAAPDEPDDEE
jgi:hypothetical protein